MTPVRKYLGAAFVAAALLGASACGASGGSDKSDDTTTTTKVEQTTTTEAETTTTEAETTTTEATSDDSVEEWASGFCGAFGTWLDNIKAAGNSVSAASTPAEAKQKLIDLFDQVGGETDTLISTVKDLPAPDIEDGDELNDDFIAKFSKFGDAIDSAKSTIEAADPNSPTFKSDAQAALTSFQTEVSTVGSSFGDLDTKYPDPAFQAALKSECASAIGG